MIVLLLFMIIKYIQSKIRKRRLYKPVKKKNKLEKKESEDDKFKKAIPNEIDLDDPYWAKDTRKNKQSENTISNKKGLLYHINNEGKIYPCKTTNCPYGKEIHSNNKVDLYYTLIETHGVRVEPHKEVLEEIVKYTRLKNLYPLASTLEQADYPIDVIVATLGNALITIDEKTIKDKYYIYSKRENFESSAASSIATLIHSGGHKRFKKIRDRIPNKILKLGLEELNRLEEDFNGGPNRNRYLNKEKTQKFSEERLRSKFAEFEEYRKDENWRLYDGNESYHKYYSWFIRAFEQFSHDLNTSNIINQPIFYESFEQAKETIRNLKNDELFSAFDDCSITVEEIEKFVREANYFNFTRRRDLTKKANDNLSRWYAMNRETYIKFRQMSSSHRDVLAIEAAKELDRRGLYLADIIR